MNRKAIYWTVGVAVVLVPLMAYGSSRQKDSVDSGQTAGTTSTAADGAGRSDEATAVAVSMLEAYNAGDYPAFSAHFTDALLADFTEAAFAEWRAPLLTSIGTYREILDVTVKDAAGGQANRHVFHASFENDPSVQFAIVFKPGTDRINRVELKPEK